MATISSLALARNDIVREHNGAAGGVLPDGFESDPDERASRWLEKESQSPRNHIGRFNAFSVSSLMTSLASDITALGALRAAVYSADLAVIQTWLEEKQSDLTEAASRQLLANSDRANWVQGAGDNNPANWADSHSKTLSDAAQQARALRRIAANTPGHPLNARQRATQANDTYCKSLSIVYGRIEAIRIGLEHGYDVSTDSITTFNSINPPQAIQDWLDEASSRLSKRARSASSMSAICMVINNGFDGTADLMGKLRSANQQTFTFNTAGLGPDRSQWAVRLNGIGAAFVLPGSPADEPPGGDPAGRACTPEEWSTRAAQDAEQRAFIGSWQFDVRIVLPTVSYNVDAYEHHSEAFPAKCIWLTRVGAMGPGGPSLATIPTMSLGVDAGRPLPDSFDIILGPIVRTNYGALKRDYLEKMGANGRLKMTDMVLVLDLDFTKRSGT